jgi:uncharacterized protein (DUF1778 family)
MTTKTYRKIAMDWPPDDLDTVERAAKAAGMSRAAFIRAGAKGLAEKVLDDRPEVDVPVFARKQAD